MKEKKQTLLEKQSGLLQAQGWSLKSVEHYVKSFSRPDLAASEAAFEEVQLFASPLFQELWRLEFGQLSSRQAQRLLSLAMTLVGMPAELNGSQEEARILLARIAPDISPADSFWRLFSQTVEQAFPADEFASKGGNEGLKRQVHQFRYVISAQQAQWVRDRYKKAGMTDAAALAAYFKSDARLSYDIGPSARLHNKAYIDQACQPAKAIYPSGKSYQANFKVLMNFHTEFILDSDGNFLNEMDPEGASINGIVNGASFNYGRNDSIRNHHSHSRYDVRTPALWDPLFRVRVVKNGGKRFVSPSYSKDERGYLAKDGLYAQQGRSAKYHVDRACRDFKVLLGRDGWKWFRYLKKAYFGIFKQE